MSGTQLHEALTPQKNSAGRVWVTQPALSFHSLGVWLNMMRIPLTCRSAVGVPCSAIRRHASLRQISIAFQNKPIDKVCFSRYTYTYQVNRYSDSGGCCRICPHTRLQIKTPLRCPLLRTPELQEVMYEDLSG